jgi:transposase
MRYALTDYEWTAIKPMLPNKPRGVPRGKRPTRSQWNFLGFAIPRRLA